MSKKRSDKKISTPRLIISLIAFILIAGVLVLAAVNYRDLSVDAMGRTLRSWFGMTERVRAFYYEGREPAEVAALSGGIVTVSDTGFAVYDEYGDKIADRDVVMSEPVIVTGGSVAGIYDKGGKTLFIADDKGGVKVYESPSSLTSVSVNRKGWFALCTEETNYKGSVTVLNGQRKAVYKFYSGDGYLLSAVVSDNNKKLTAVKLNASGSQLVEYRLDSEEPVMTADIADEVAIRCKYGAYGSLTVLTDSSLINLNEDGTVKNSFDFSDYALADYSTGGDGYSVLYCEASQPDTRASLMTVDDSGKLISKVETLRDIKDIAALGQYIAVLYSDGLTIYDKSLRERGTYETAPDAMTVLMRSDGTAIVSGEYSAAVLG